MDKQERLATARHKHARLDEIIRSNEGARLTEPGLAGGWSVKDTLAHITTWERRLVTALQAAMRGEPPVWPEPGYTFRDTDRLNARDFEANRDRSLEDVVSAWHMAFEELSATIELFTEDDLIQPDRWPWANGMALIQLIRPSTDEHYEEHADAIEAWLGCGGQTA